MKKCILGPQHGFATQAVHTGNDIDQDSGAIKPTLTISGIAAIADIAHHHDHSCGCEAPERLQY